MMRLLQHLFFLCTLMVAIHLPVAARTAATYSKGGQPQRGRSRTTSSKRNHHHHHQSKRHGRCYYCYAFQMPILSTPNFKFPPIAPTALKALTTKMVNVVRHGVYCGPTPGKQRMMMMLIYLLTVVSNNDNG